MLDEVDNAWRDLLNKESISLTDEEFKKARPTRSIRRMLEIREMGKNEQWALLIPLLKSNSISAPLGTNDLEMHWVSVLAVNQLIKKPEVTVPLLLAEVKEGNNNNWLYYALGQCGTPKALDAVEARILNVKNIYTISGCVFSLSQAGEEGEKRISKLAETATANLKIAIENSHNRQYAHLYSRERQYHFPVISQDIELPATWIEVETLIESVNKYAAGGKLGNESYRKLVDGLDAGLSFTEKTTPQEKTAFRILRKETIPAIGKSILPYLWYKAEYSSEEDVVEYCIGAIMDIEGLSKTNEKEF